MSENLYFVEYRNDKKNKVIIANSITQKTGHPSLYPYVQYVPSLPVCTKTWMDYSVILVYAMCWNSFGLVVKYL